MVMRNSSLSFKEKLVVQRTIEDSFAYLIDLVNLVEWHPAVLAVKQISKGPPSLNWEYEIRYRIGIQTIQMRMHIAKIVDNKEIILRGESRFFSYEETIKLSHETDLTGIEYQSEIHLKEYWSYLTPVFRPIFTQINRSAIGRLEKALGEQPHYQPARITERLADRLIIPGLAKFTRFGYELEHRFWYPNAGFLQGKSAVVVGGCSAIGQAVVTALSRLGARVLVADVDEKKGLLLQKHVLEKTGNEIIFEPANLSELGATIALASRIYQHFESLDILINAASRTYARRLNTSEGVEKTFAVNLLCPFVLTESLHELLKRSQTSRIINVTSAMMYTQKLRLDDLDSKERPYQGNMAFARAMRGMVDITEQWAEKWQADQIFVHCMHPGWTDTQSLRNGLATPIYRLMKPVLRTPEQGADTIVWLASSPVTEESNGLFWLDRRPHPTALIAGTQSSAKSQKQLYEQLLAFWEKLTEKKTGT